MEVLVFSGIIRNLDLMELGLDLFNFSWWWLNYGEKNNNYYYYY